MKKAKIANAIIAIVAAVCISLAAVGCSGNGDIALDKDEINLYVGESVKLTATTKSKDALVWKSGDYDVATVMPDGTVTAVSIGETVVTVTAGNYSASAVVKVTAIPEFTLSQTRAVLEKHDDITVKALLDGEEAVAEWSSANTAVATVSGGNIVAVEAGTTTVTATIGDRRLDVAVSVTDSGVYPTVAAQSSIALNAGKTFEFMPKINFNANLKDDGEFTYDIEDDEIATVTANGVITGVKKGSTVLTVGGSWRGMTLIPFEVELSVYDDIVYNFDSRNVTVATSDQGAAHVNKVALNPEIKVNGQAVALSDCTFTVADPQIASVDGNGVLTGLKEGETTVEVCYKGEDVYPATVNVKVYIPVLKSDVTETITLEALRVNSDDKASVDNVFGLDNVTKINFGGKDIPASLSGNEILFDGAEVDKFGKREVTVYSDKVAYTCSMNIISMNIGSPQDLAAITRLNTAATIDGIYYVTADIDASSAGIVRIVNNNTQSSDAAGFKGIFDGQGHIISNLKTEATVYNGLGGLFGQLLEGSEVRNVAFTNMQIESKYKCLFVGESKMMSGTIENVLVTSSSEDVRVIWNLAGNGEIKNMLAVIENGYINNNRNNLAGAFNKTKVSDIMSVTNNASQNYGGFSWTDDEMYKSQPNYATVSDMLDALESDNALAAWDSPITYSDGAIYFNGVKVIE